MDERFPAADDRLAVADPEPPPGSARHAPTPVGRATAEAYMELLATHLRQLEEYLYDLTERRDELLAEEEYLTARIRELRRTVEGLEDEEGTTSRAGSAVWSRLWERPPRVVAEAADPTGGRSADHAIVDLRTLSERGYLTATRAHRRSKVTRSLLLSLAGVAIAGTLLAAVVILGPSGATRADRPTALTEQADRAAAPADGYVPTTMPDVVGDRVSDAVRAIARAELTVVDLRIVRGPADVVVASDPTTGEAVATGTGVTLSVGRG